jgi:hypothetical protein
MFFLLGDAKREWPRDIYPVSFARQTVNSIRELTDESIGKTRTRARATVLQP